MTLPVSQQTSQAEDIATKLCAYLRENILSPEVEIKSDTGLGQVGVDSFSLMEMILFIERCYGLILPPESLTPENIATVESLSQYCATQLSQTNG